MNVQAGSRERADEAGGRPRLLVLTSRFPYPVVGGDRLRIWQVCRALSGAFDLTLLSLCETRAELAAPVPDDGVFAAVERFRLPTWRSWVGSARALPSRRPLQVGYYEQARYLRRAQELAATHGGVFAHLVRTADVALRLDLPRFCELTDAISLNYTRARETTDGVRDVRTVAYAVEQRRLRAYERRVVAGMDHSFVVSDVDRDFLTPAGDPLRAKLSVSPNGVDVGALPFTSGRRGGELVFVGNLASVQNLDAALHAARDVLPLVRRRHPDATLTVVGRIDEKRAGFLRAFPGVRVTGEVPSIPDAVASAAVGLAPLRIGAGVQNKVLEYAALGLPIVTTPLALEGLGARPDAEVLVGTTPVEQADAVCSLLDDPDRADRLAAAARTYVERTHDWATLLQPLVDRVRAGVERR